MIKLKYLLPAMTIAALHLFGASVSVGQTSSDFSQRKSRLPLAPASVFQRGLSGSQVDSLGSPAITPTSTDGVHVFRNQTSDVVTRRAYGTIKIPFTTKRVAVSILGASTAAAQVPVTSYPYRATGKLVVTDGGQDFDRTAALIRRGLLLTAAHCIQNYGKSAAGKADAVQWIPAEYSTAAGGPYGVWVASYWTAVPPYINGTDTCDVDAEGVACDNDIALVVLKQKTINGVATWPSKLVGTYAVAVDGYSFVAAPLLGNQRLGLRLHL